MTNHLVSNHLVTAALAWNPQVRGALYVLIALVVLPGSVFLLLSTNMGARLGFLMAAAGFFGWMFTLSAVWWVYGTGPKGREPTWKPKETITGDIAQETRNPAAAHFPAGWKKMDIAAPEVADAQSVVDAKIVGPKAQFKSSSDFLPVLAAETGGEKYGPFHLLNFRPFNVFHEPHYLVIQVQKAVKPPGVAGQPPPKAAVDPQAPTVAVIMIRDLGALRENPGVVCVSTGLLFAVLCYSLHTRDKEAMAQRV
ncbi:MAG: hypothetical protein ACR2LJ_01615 [Acidimicrobiales bacterium]